MNELTDDADPHPELFDAAIDTLSRLMEGHAPVDVVLLRWELTALRLLGHQPALVSCAECGKEVGKRGRVAFGQLSGGVLCEACRPGKRQIVSVSEAAITALRQLADESAAPGESVALARSTSGELRGLMNQYLCNLFGRKLRMHGYLGTKAS